LTLPDENAKQSKANLLDPIAGIVCRAIHFNVIWLVAGVKWKLARAIIQSLKSPFLIKRRCVAATQLVSKENNAGKTGSKSCGELEHR
jgi:hypothetical protein